MSLKKKKNQLTYEIVREVRKKHTLFEYKFIPMSIEFKQVGYKTYIFIQKPAY